MWCIPACVVPLKKPSRYHTWKTWHSWRNAAVGLTEETQLRRIYCLLYMCSHFPDVQQSVQPELWKNTFSHLTPAVSSHTDSLDQISASTSKQWMWIELNVAPHRIEKVWSENWTAQNAPVTSRKEHWTQTVSWSNVYGCVIILVQNRQIIGPCRYQKLWQINYHLFCSI